MRYEEMCAEIYNSSIFQETYILNDLFGHYFKTNKEI